MTENILVTGSAGFVGFYLCKKGNRILSSQVLENYESDHFPIRVKF